MADLQIVGLGSLSLLPAGPGVSDSASPCLLCIPARWPPWARAVWMAPESPQQEREMRCPPDPAETIVREPIEGR